VSPVSPVDGPSLFDHATRLHELRPDAPLPRGGRTDLVNPLPRGDPPSEVRKLHAAFDRFFADPSAPVRTLHDSLCRIRVLGWMFGPDEPSFPLPDAVRGREAGRWLIRRGTDHRAVLAGLALLVRTARPDDAVALRMIGLLEHLTPWAVRALVTLPDASEHLIWLAERTERQSRACVVDQLLKRGDQVATGWLRRHGLEGIDPIVLYRRAGVDLALGYVVEYPEMELRSAGRELMSVVASGPARIAPARYREARLAFRELVRRLAAAPHPVRDHELVAALAEEFRSGHAACLGWEAGELGDLRSTLFAILRRPEVTDYLDREIRFGAPGRRTWHDSVRRIAAEVPTGPFRIHVVVPGPVWARDVETRVLIDGWPVVAAAFDTGAPCPPSTLLANGVLRATAGPHEVCLAEAYRTDGASGELYVTIARDADEVVWRDWRGHTSAEPPPELRFPARAYDAEVARAGADRSWEPLVPWSPR
jgi:hypothetical protein